MKERKKEALRRPERTHNDQTLNLSNKIGTLNIMQSFLRMSPFWYK